MKHAAPLNMNEETAQRLTAFHGPGEEKQKNPGPEPTKPVPVVFPMPPAPSAVSTEDFDLEVVSRTDTGLVRKVNQDAVIADAPLFGVADGMGGHQGGEIASAECREDLVSFLSGKAADLRLLEAAVKVANRRIHIRSLEEAGLAGMGTTLTALWFSEKNAYLAQVGDSRCYLLRDGSLRQVTQDHSMVMELVRAGVITEEEAATHPMRNVITRAIGTDRAVEVDLYTEDRKSGDVWLICSDGLYGQVPKNRLQELMEKDDLELSADILLQETLDAGAPDNVSLVLVRDGRRQEAVA